MLLGKVILGGTIFRAS